MDRCDNGRDVSDRHIADLRSMLGDDRFAPLLRRFARDIAVRIDEIASPSQATELIADSAHKLVGTAGALGLRELATASNRLMECARAPVDADRLSIEVQSTVLAAQHAIRELECALDQP